MYHRFPKVVASAVLSLLTGIAAAPAFAEDEPYVGEIVCYPYTFAPRGWLVAQGQVLQISQYSALFSLLGTTYGGDGRTTFALPDLRARSMISAGAGPGLSQRFLGDFGGQSSLTLNTTNLPPHSHSVAPPASTSAGTQTSPGAGVPGTNAANVIYTAPNNGAVAMASNATLPAGAGVPIANRQPYLTLNCAIAVEGLYPARQ